MATQAQIDSITALYAGYFNRAPDPAGLQFWIDALDGGRDYNTIAADFASSPEAIALYPYLETPGVSSPSAFITSIYANLFDRAPDADGLAFWVGKLTAGEISVADMIEAIINGARDDAAAGTFDATTLANKVEVGLYFAETAGDTPGFVYDAAAAAAAVEALNGVTSDPVTVDEGKAEVDEFLNPTTESFTLTTATDSGAAFVGGAVDSVFNADLGLGIDGLVGVQTLQGPDVLDGGAGFNVLNAELNGTGTTANPTISNIQQYNLTSFNNIFGSGVLDLDRATGYEQLWNRDSRADLTVENVGEVAILGMDNVRDGSTYNVDYDNIAVENQIVVVDRSGRPGESVELDIDGVDGTITNFALNVSNGVHLFLDDDAADMDNLTIAGSGVLVLEGEDQFENLVTLDTLGYDGDVNLDISGSGTLESVLTGDGNDVITASAATFSADTPATTLDLGMGENRLILVDTFETQPAGTYTGGSVIDEDELSALDFTLAPVSNVQTLELVDVGLDDDASLDLDGVGGLETLVFTDFDNSGYDLLIDNSPEVLEITTAQEIEMNGGLFTIEGVVNLTMTSTGIDTDSDIRLDGGVNSSTLETLFIDVADDAELLLEGGTDALTTVNVVAVDDADVEMTIPGVLGDDAELAALTTVNVTGASATLNMTGRAGVVGFAGAQAFQQFAINVTGGASSGFPAFARSVDGNAFFTGGSLASGFIDTTYSNTQLFSTAANPALDTGAAFDVANAIDGTMELEATNTGNVVNVTWANVGIVNPLTNQFGLSGATTGTLDSVLDLGFSQGLEAIAQVDGEGFEAVETITVDATDGNANVNLIDVYGLFTLNVTATDDAFVNLINTNATSVTVAAGNFADVFVGGNNTGAQNLVDLTVSGFTAEVDLADNLESFTTLDVSGVVADVIVDTSLALFNEPTGQFVNYLIGATQDGTAGLDVTFTGNLEAREVYDFVGDNIGEVEINNFDISADITFPGDRLDLSGFASNAGQLAFTIDANDDIVITDLAGGPGDFDGSITIVGTYNVTDAANFANFNIIYA